MGKEFAILNDVYLRGIQKEDFTERMYNWANDDEVTHYMFTGLKPSTKEGMEKWFNDTINSINSNSEVVFTIVDKESDKPIGLVGLYSINHQIHSAEFRIIIGEKSYWGKGIGSECARWVIGYAFRSLNMNKVWLGVNEENLGAVKSYEKAGFIHEGRLRQEIYRNNRYYDAVKMSLLKSEWETQCKKESIGEELLTLNKYKTAIIGCGRIGCGFDDDPKRKYAASHIKAYSLNPNTQLVALADIDTEKLAKYAEKYNVPKTYTDYKEMLAIECPDILSICTWNSTHYEIVCEAVKQGVKAVFCEKPISDTIENAKKLIQVCSDHKVILMIDHMRRFDKTHVEIKRFIDGGGIGSIQQASFNYTAGIANTGSHMFDLIRFLLGDVDWITSFPSSTLAPNPKDPNFDGLIKLKSGATCTIQACDVKEFTLFEFVITGTKGRIKISKAGFKVEYDRVEDSDVFSGYKELTSHNLPFNHYPVDFMNDAVAHIIYCLEHHKIPNCSGEDGLASLELICAFHESAQHDGKKIHLPLEKSDVIISSM